MGGFVNPRPPEKIQRSQRPSWGFLSPLTMTVIYRKNTVMAGWEKDGKTYKLFLDLDGVLADFDQGVRDLLGKTPDQLPEKQMWAALARSRGFYAHLDWMPDGRQLWESVRHVGPVIVSGVPWGNWAEPQKRRWCRQHLGAEVPVVLCRSREKGRAVLDYLHPGEVAVLIDDRLQAREGWLDIGGIYILHTSAQNSLEQLRQLGFDFC